MLCVGVINMHSTGIAGSGFMVIYKRSTKTTAVINFREKAPAAAKKDMFVNSTEESIFGKSKAPSTLMRFQGKGSLHFGN
jgi:gamma-glutamyltranspeptidase/glutathione hydrolase/leukotriene-C4 hydrolase